MSLFQIHATLTGYSRIDFEKKLVRKGMMKIGREHQKGQRKRASRKRTSKAGQYPGKRVGALQKSIKYKISRPGFLVGIGPRKKELMAASGKEDFYPAILVAGVRQGAVRKRSHKKQGTDAPFRIWPRGNFAVDEAYSKRDWTKNVILETLQDALVPKK